MTRIARGEGEEIMVAFAQAVADLDVIPPSLEDIYSHFSRRDGQ